MAGFIVEVAYVYPGAEILDFRAKRALMEGGASRFLLAMCVGGAVRCPRLPRSFFPVIERGRCHRGKPAVFLVTVLKQAQDGGSSQHNPDAFLFEKPIKTWHGNAGSPVYMKPPFD